VLGADRKMLRSRSGVPVKLVDLLDEAVQRADAAVTGRDPSLAHDERDRVAQMLGVGAVKYADLSTERTRDYTFDWDRMLAFEGNTGPYLQYAHARIRSIFRRGNLSAPSSYPTPNLVEPAERALGLALLGFAGAIEATLEQWSPSRLCSYLFELATAFTTFYETCPVLKAPPDVLPSRVLLCELTGRVLERGLDLLGIQAPDQM